MCRRDATWTGIDGTGIAKLCRGALGRHGHWPRLARLAKGRAPARIWFRPPAARLWAVAKAWEKNKDHQFGWAGTTAWSKSRWPEAGSSQTADQGLAHQTSPPIHHYRPAPGPRRIGAAGTAALLGGLKGRRRRASARTETYPIRRSRSRRHSRSASTSLPGSSQVLLELYYTRARC